MEATSLLLYGDREERSVLVRGTRIAQVGPELKSTSAEAALDCSGSLVRPGAVNAHTHLYSGLAPLGMPKPHEQPRTFPEILERIWWRLDRALDARSLRASARLYVAEALLHGTTTLIDHHESPNLIEESLEILADACQELGARALLCYGATERNDGRAEARRGLAECKRFLLANRRPLVSGMVGLHAGFTVSDDTVREAALLCTDLDTTLHVHLAEDRCDVEDAQRRGFEGPLERLEQLGALPAGSVLAHGVHLSDAQVRRAEELHCWLVQNPRSNEANGVGYARSLRQSRHVALGTDGFPSDMAAEAHALEEVGLPAGEALEALAHRRAGGHALLHQQLGRAFVPLAEGTTADLVAQGWQGDPGRARHVIVDGRLVVRDGQLLTGDLAHLRAEAEEEALKLWRRMVAL